MNPTGINILLGDGKGSFAAPLYFPLVGSAEAFAISDLNGDGRRTSP